MLFSELTKLFAIFFQKNFQKLFFVRPPPHYTLL
jgi:hypothetical protein